MPPNIKLSAGKRRVMHYRTLKDMEYRSQNKRGGRPMVIVIPAGSIGVKQNDFLCFHVLSRNGHNPFVFLKDAYPYIEEVHNSELTRLAVGQSGGAQRNES